MTTGAALVDAPVQMARVPRDLLGAVAHEIGRVEMPPQRALGVLGDRVEAQQAARLVLPLLQRILQRARGALAGEHAPRRVEQVLEELRLPCVPHARARAADVGDGQDVERGQPALAADLRRERGDDVGIGDVLLLRGRRHREVLADEPADELGVLARQAVRAAEPPRLALAERRVVAAAALGDVVEQAGEVEHLPAREIGDEPRAQRIFVRVLRLGEPAQVADHHQDVLVHRVDVEEVVLHLADDAAERRQVMAEDAVQVHPPQLVRLAARLAENLQEPRAVGRVAAEARRRCDCGCATARAASAPTCP